ncbi:hypothetical protein JW979_00505 [bacterium]|nr:hypothetical protein [candidate division CSSED10-310 bacterium]
MSLIEQINRDYEKVLAGTDPVGQMESLTKRMWDKGMFMEIDGEKRPFPTFMKPYFVDMKHRSLIATHTRNIIKGVEKVGKLFLEGHDFKGLIHQEGRIAELSKVDPIYPSLQVMVRLDCFYHPDTGEMKFLEFNCGDPSGMGWNDAMLDIFLSLPAIQKFAELYDLHTDHLLETHLQAMLKKYNEFCAAKGLKAKEKPTFAIVCWRKSTILNDVLEIVETYKRHGYDAVFADPSDFNYDGKTVTVDGTLIDAVYRDAIDDFIKPQYWPHCQDIINAYRDGNICFVNPVRAATGDFKTLPAIMSDENYRNLFSEEEWDTMIKTVPWTRQVKNGITTSFHSEKGEMSALLKRNKDAFVLKPNEGYGGFGIFIGIDCSQKEWENAVDKAVAPGSDYAVQEFVKIPIDRFPVIENGKFKGFFDRNVNINYWSHAGEFAGAFLRAAVGNVINVHQGGGLVPVFFVSEKK